MWKKYRAKCKKKSVPSPYKKAFALLDTVFSFFIRARGKMRTGGMCEICGKRSIEVCFHFFPRKNLATRFEPDAACATDRGCNYEEHMRRGITESDIKFRAAHVRLVGEARVKELEEIKRQPRKWSAAELMDMKRDIETKLAKGEWI